MTPFEEKLKASLARQEPSAGFTARVLSQVSARKAPPRKAVSWRLAVAAAATFLVVGGAAYRQYDRQHERQIQGEAAKHKLLLALRIAGSKLQQTQDRVNQIENSEAIQ
jgi:hypothetical protein